MDFQENSQHSTQQVEEKKYTIDEYFAFETNSERKHEYYDGKIVECAYTSENHGEIIHNLNGLFYNCLRGKGCKVYPSDRMVYVKRCNRFYYPDIVIVCGQREYYQYSKNQVATINPSVLIEVLSESTQNVDKNDKWKCYRRIPSLKQYVLVEQDIKSVQVYEYDEVEKRWIPKLYENSGDVINIAGCEIPLDEIYFEVELIEGEQKSDK